MVTSNPIEEVFKVSLTTTRACWEHIMDLLSQDHDPAWRDFNQALIHIIEEAEERYVGLQPPSGLSYPVPVLVDAVAVSSTGNYEVFPEQISHSGAYFGYTEAEVGVITTSFDRACA